MIFPLTACVLIFTNLPITLVHTKLIDKTLKNISDEKLIVQTNTYIRNHRSDIDGVGLRRQYHQVPTDRLINIKILEMMRQQVYAAQDRMRRLTPTLAKYKKDVPFRMAFIFNRLNQLIIDIRRVYTQALRWKQNWKRVMEHIVWYTHIIRKYMDVLYIVEHAIDIYDGHMKNIDGNLV